MAFEPLTQVQYVPSHFHKSFKLPAVVPESRPKPPNSHRLFEESVHATDETRAPGWLPLAGTFWVPYTPDWETVSEPLTQVQLLPFHFHKSFSRLEVPALSRPVPPNNHRLPD